MDNFEEKLGEIFDFNRFESTPELQKYINDFENKYLANEKKSDMRERVSFAELEGSGQKLIKPPEKTDSKELQAGKGLGKKT